MSNWGVDAGALPTQSSMRPGCRKDPGLLHFNVTRSSRETVMELFRFVLHSSAWRAGALFALIWALAWLAALFSVFASTSVELASVQTALKAASAASTVAGKAAAKPASDPKTIEHVDDIRAHVGHRIAAFHHEYGGQAGGRQHATDLDEVTAAQAEARDRVALEGVDAQRHDQRIGALLPHLGQRLQQRLAPALEAAAARQRQVQVAAEARAMAPLVGVAKVERILGDRVAVDRGGEHVVALVEDALRAVAMVVVDVDDRHARGARVAQGLCGEGRVVEKAVAAEEVGAGVVARRAGERQRRAGTGRHGAGGIDRTRRAGERRLPSARAEWRAGVERIQPDAG